MANSRVVGGARLPCIRARRPTSTGSISICMHRLWWIAICRAVCVLCERGGREGAIPKFRSRTPPWFRSWANEARPRDVILYRETLHWVKHPDLVIRPNGPARFHSCHSMTIVSIDSGRSTLAAMRRNSKPHLIARALQASCPRSVLEWVSRY